MQTKTVTIRLMDIVLDMSIRHREPNEVRIGEYRQALRAGATFPPIVVERGTNRLVCGWNRVQMYRKELPADTEVDCIFETYPDELAIWQRAVSDNVAHGTPLSTWDKKRIVLRMQELGASKRDIAVLLNVTPERLDDWNGMTVVVIGSDGAESPRPLKHDQTHHAGERMSQEQYDRLEQYGRGIKAGRLAFDLRRLLENNGVDLENDATVRELKGLREALDKFLSVNAVA